MERRRTLAVLEQSLGERILSRVNHTSFAARGSQSQNFHVYFPSVEWPFPFAFPSRPAAEKIVPPIATVEFDSSHSRRLPWAEQKGRESRMDAFETCKEEFATPFCSPPSTLPPLSLFILLLSLDKKLLPWFDEIRCIILFIWNSLLLYLTKFDVLNYLLETRGDLLLICGQLKMINLDNLWLLWMIIYYLLYILLLLPPLSFSNLFISLSSLSEKG